MPPILRNLAPCQQARWANAVAGERRPIRLSADAENLYHPDPSAEDRFEQFRRLRRTATLEIT
jgi:hypothetical protein